MKDFSRLFCSIGDMRSRQMLEDALQACAHRSSKSVLTWWARLDSIFAEFELIGAGKSDEEKKAKAMFLVGDDLATLDELLGAGDNTYLQFQTAMLKQERERRIYGVVRDQGLADATASRIAPPRNLSHTDPTAMLQLTDGAFAVGQSWRGSGFRPPRGHANRANQRHNGQQNRGGGRNQQSHNREGYVVLDKHSKEMTCKLETTDQSTFSDQCHRMNGNG